MEEASQLVTDRKISAKKTLGETEWSTAAKIWGRNSGRV